MDQHLIPHEPESLDEMLVRGLQRHEPQDTTQSSRYCHFHQESEKDGEMIFVQDLEQVRDSIEEAPMLTDSSDPTCELKKSLPTRPSSRSPPTNENTMVGFDDDLVQLKDRLTSGGTGKTTQSKLQIIPIVGMGGTGKTTLTKNLYNDDHMVEYFDIRTWVTVSQQYRVRDILLGLLESIRSFTPEMREKSDDYLSEFLYKSLKGRRYLIAMDDVWTTEVMDEMKMLFPDDQSGSRIIVTTRLSEVEAYANSHGAHQHHMHFLSEQESWDLLCHKVFMGEGCPPELEESGKRIAQSCKGLPLAIVVIAGLLTKVERTQGHWEHVGKNVNSIVIANDVQCSELLSLSYSHLPHHLKRCFLYMGVFPEDHTIHTSKLIKLWVAEGIINSISYKTLEEVAEEYLEDLISRNLILVGEKSIDGKIKTCSIHDLLRDLCVKKAKEEKFHLAIHIDTFVHGLQEIIPHRLAIHGDVWNDDIARDIRNSVGKLSPVRSLLCPRLPWIFILSSDLFLCKLLRILDLGALDFCRFPTKILQLVHLRYLCFSCNRNFHISEYLPDYLRNLQTLIIYQGADNNGITGTQVFWRMPQLRHLQFEKCYLDCPFQELVGNENPVLEDLQTLSKITGSSCTPELFKRTPNLKKLGIWVEKTPSDNEPFSLGNLVNLNQLQFLRCIVDEEAHVSIPKTFTFPQNLRKLTLKHTRIPWKDMSLVGSLPNLLVLKLIDNAFEGKEWEPVDGEFGQLKYLLIDGADLQCWRAEKDHFPRLEQLSLWECSKLEEIPCGIGDIPTLKKLELDDNSPSAMNSAKRIQEEQQSLGNEQLQVTILHIWEVIHEKRIERVHKEKMHMETMELLKGVEMISRPQWRLQWRLQSPTWIFGERMRVPERRLRPETMQNAAAERVYKEWKIREKMNKDMMQGMRVERSHQQRVHKEGMKAERRSKYATPKR